MEINWWSLGIGSLIVAGGGIWLFDLVFTNVTFLGSVALSTGMVWFGVYIIKKAIK